MTSEYRAPKGLIDGDGFIYRAGFSVEKIKYGIQWPDGGFTVHETKREADSLLYDPTTNAVLWTRKEVGTLEEAIRTMDSWLKEAMGHAGCKDYGIYISPGVGNYRDKLGTVRKYKGNREDHARPTYYYELREYIGRKYTTLIGHQEEADDTCSWMARYLASNNEPYIVIGHDKDLKQIPGRHYDWVKKGYFHVSDDEALLFFWTQVLSGDTTDNIVGCWKTGEKGAVNIVLNCTSLKDEDVWPVVVEEYRKSQALAGCPYKDLDPAAVALEMARLVRLKHFAHEHLWVPKLKLKTPIDLEVKDGSGQKNEKEQDPSTSSFARLAGAETPSAGSAEGSGN